jgi:hypothetical protein
MAMSNQFLVHPHNGGISFGQVPEMNNRGFLILEGEIRLVSGKHIGPNRGWGASHIWAEHRNEMAAKGFDTYQEVPNYVASIVNVGTRLFFSNDNMRNVRLMAVRSTSGTAILEFKDRREGPIWSVVTAYAGVRTHGTRVGTVR